MESLYLNDTEPMKFQKSAIFVVLTTYSRKISQIWIEQGYFKWTAFSLNVNI